MSDKTVKQLYRRLVFSFFLVYDFISSVSFDLAG